jgi:uncharacterized membrane protein (GlpM family)
MNLQWYIIIAAPKQPLYYSDDLSSVVTISIETWSLYQIYMITLKVHLRHCHYHQAVASSGEFWRVSIIIWAVSTLKQKTDSIELNDMPTNQIAYVAN